MRKICACHQMSCCHGNGLNVKIDNQNILSLISTVPMLRKLTKFRFVTRVL